MSDSHQPPSGPDREPGADPTPDQTQGQTPDPGAGQAPDAPGYGTPPPDAPAYGTPPPGGPQYGGPQYGGQQYGAPPPGAPQYGGPHYGAPPPYGARMHPAQERTWCSAAHWSALVAGLVTSGIFAFAGPLLVMLVKGNESPRVRAQAVESLNFQISMLIYAIVSVVLWLVLIGILLSIAVGIAWLVLTIMAAVKANNGEDYRYPLTLRMVS